MINLVKKENINLGILETDFDIFSDIVNTFPDESFKQDCILDLDDYILPNYFRDKVTIVIQTNDILIGYVIFEFVNKNSSSQVEIKKIYVLDDFKDKMMEALLVESVIYMAGEVGARNIIVSIKETDFMFEVYRSLGFYEIGINDIGCILSVNVTSAVAARKLNDKFRDIEKDYIDYKDLKLNKKITTGRTGNIYLTDDGRILKMFNSTSFTYIKDREETLRVLKKEDISNVVKPKNLVYYDGVFIGYLMDYLPKGTSLYKKGSTYSFEEKIEKLNKIEEIMKMLHKKNIYICDLNLDNIFIDENGDVKLIDCDAFIIKKNVVNSSVAKKYQDPVYGLVSEKTDMYAFAITALELLIDEKIDDDLTSQDIEKIYNKNKNKLPVSFKTYFEGIFKSKERYYLSDSYKNYLNNIYNGEIDQNDVEDKKGNISVIILSTILLVIAIMGYIVFKFKIGG